MRAESGLAARYRAAAAGGGDAENARDANSSAAAFCLRAFHSSEDMFSLEEPWASRMSERGTPLIFVIARSEFNCDQKEEEREELEEEDDED